MGTHRALVAVVEDDASMRHAIERMLRVSGFGCVGFDSAEAYLAARFDAVPDCAVIDINLGAIGGLELQSMLSAEGASLPVVAITALESDAVRHAAIEQGCVAFLVKPFSGAALVDAVRTGLRRNPPPVKLGG